MTDQELCALAPREWADPPAAVWGGHQWSILSHTATCSQPVWMETGAYLHKHPPTHGLGASEAQSQALWDSSNPSLGLSLLLPPSSLQDGQLLPARLCVSGGPSPLVPDTPNILPLPGIPPHHSHTQALAYSIYAERTSCVPDTGPDLEHTAVTSGHPALQCGWQPGRALRYEGEHFNSPRLLNNVPQYPSFCDKHPASGEAQNWLGQLATRKRKQALTSHSSVHSASALPLCLTLPSVAKWLPLFQTSHTETKGRVFCPLPTSLFLFFILRWGSH